MTTWQITIKCILCCSMRSQMRWKKSKNRISVMPKTSSSPPSKRQKNSISPQRTKKAAVPRAASAAMPQFPSQSFLRISTIFPAAASAAMPPPPPQSAARLPSLAPHGVGRGCNMNRHAEDSWRSHVHRTYTAQRVQSFKLQTANVGGRGGDSPRLSLGVPKGVFSSEREYPLCLAAAQRAALTHAAPTALQPPPPRKGRSKGIPSPEREYPLCLAAAQRAARTHAAQRAATPIPRKGEQPPAPSSARKKGSPFGLPFLRLGYSTVTDFARLRGLSISHPRWSAI